MNERPKAPVWLTLALALGLLIGAGGAFTSSALINVFRERPMALTPEAGTEAWKVDFTNVSMEVLAAHRRTELPLAIANALLSGLLVFASLRALGRVPGARSLLTQALLANGALAVLAFALTVDARNKLAMAWADHVPRAGFWSGSKQEIVARMQLQQRAGLALLLATYVLLLRAVRSEAARNVLPEAVDPPDDDD